METPVAVKEGEPTSPSPVVIPSEKPKWMQSIFESYNSRASNIFVLYGNTADIYLGKTGDLSLKDYIEETCGAREIVLHVDPASDITIEKGHKWVEAFLNSNQGTFGDIHKEEPLDRLHRFMLYLANLPEYHSTTIFITNPAHLVGKQNDPKGALLIKRWSEDPHFSKEQPLILLVGSELQELHSLITKNQRIEKIEIPYPSVAEVEALFARKKDEFPKAFSEMETPEKLGKMAGVMAGTSLQGILSLIRKKNYRKEPLKFEDLEAMKLRLVEQESRGLISFLPGGLTLDNLSGKTAAAIRKRLEGDIRLWKEGKFKKIPNGYLFVGPPGTGKTFFIRCLAGSAGIPVLVINNFRGEFQGQTEANLEFIFRLVRSLPRVYIFIDEADQWLGNRQQSSTDGGTSGRVYSSFAQEMSNVDNRGKICWLLATSHPKNLEIDLKRAGRIDLIIPLLPCSSAAEGKEMLMMFAKKANLNIEGEIGPIPDLLTPGAANTLIAEVENRKDRGEGLATDTETLNEILRNHKPRDPEEMLRLTRDAIVESSSKDFIPEEWQDILKAA